MSSDGSCNHAQCVGYKTCISQMREQLRHPIEQQSLYANRIYDNQTANRRCYETNPGVDIVEGFGMGNMDMGNLLKWALIVCVIYLVITFIKDSSKQTVSLGISAPATTSASYRLSP